jgi:hypothetical protein
MFSVFSFVKYKSKEITYFSLFLQVLFGCIYSDMCIAYTLVLFGCISPDMCIAYTLVLSSLVVFIYKLCKVLFMMI